MPSVLLMHHSASSSHLIIGKYIQFEYIINVLANQSNINLNHANTLIVIVNKYASVVYSGVSRPHLKEVIAMAISYKKLWKLLIDKDMMKKDLQRLAGVSSASITKLGKNENVNTEILQKICTALECDISDIMEMVPDESSN